MQTKPSFVQPTDRNGKTVHVGTSIRLLSLSGKWFQELPEHEREDVLSMVGAIFEIEEIDEHGHAWINKWWSGDGSEGESYQHSIAVEPHEIETVSKSLK